MKYASLPVNIERGNSRGRDEFKLIIKMKTVIFREKETDMYAVWECVFVLYSAFFVGVQI